MPPRHPALADSKAPFTPGTPSGRARCGGVSQQMLTRTLKQLERDGVATRTVHPTVPPQVEYALTDLGHSLSEPVIQLGQWAFAHLDVIHQSRARYDRTSGRN